MFDYIIGKPISVSGDTLVIENNGIGYKIYASDYAKQFLYKPNETVKIYIYMQVREDDVSLFGFCSENERRMFMSLTSVSGVGAKTAIAILSGMNLDNLSELIAAGDPSTLTTIKGLGKKTAERIVLELSGKLDFMRKSGESTMSDIVLCNENAVSALISLGFTRQEAVNSVKKVAANGMNTEDIIREVLKNNG